MMQIIQRKLFSPTQDVCLTEDDFIVITIKRVLSESTFKFDLRDLDPEPSRQKSIPRNAVALAIVFGFLMLTGLIPSLGEHDPIQRAPYIVSAIFWGSLLLGSVLYARLRRSDLHAYFHRYSGNVILALYHNSPNQASFNTFMNALNERLKVLNPRNIQREQPRSPEREHPFLPN